MCKKWRFDDLFHFNFTRWIKWMTNEKQSYTESVDGELLSVYPIHQNGWRQGLEQCYINYELINHSSLPIPALTVMPISTSLQSWD